MRRLPGLLLVALLAAGCGEDRRADPPVPGTPTTDAELDAVAARAHSLLATPSPAGEGRAELLKACIELRRAAEYVASEHAAAAPLRDRLGDGGRAALADAARDCTLDPAAARAAVLRLRAALS